jgi:hypothetical protein
MSVSPNMDACGSAVGGSAPHEMAYAASGSRVYACMVTMTTIIGANGRPRGEYMVVRSDDGGVTWSPTALLRFSGYNNGNTKYMGPHMCVDPNNQDICYLMSIAGIVFVTYNGGTSWSRMDGLMTNMPSATVAANVTPGGGTIHIDSIPFPSGSPGSSNMAVYNATADTTLGTLGGYDFIEATFTATGQISGTTLTVTSAPNQPLRLPDGGSHPAVRIAGAGVTTGTTITSQIILGNVATVGALPGGASLGDTYTVTGQGGVYVWNGSAWQTASTLHIGQYVVSASQTVSSTLISQVTIFAGNTEYRSGSSGPGVNSGDVLYFGMGGGVQVDGSAGTVTNPGGSGVASNLVYFSWTVGPASGSVWYTDDCGGTFFRLGSSGGPAAVPSKMRLSNDAAIKGGGNNVLYVCAGTQPTGFWRWVGNHPTGTSLADNTWTLLSTIGDTTGCSLVSPDLSTAGRVVFMSGRGGIWLSLDYGDSSGGNYGAAPIMASGRGGTDAPWLSTGVDGWSLGDCLFDRADNTKLWIADGNGIWTTTPAHNANRGTWYSQMDNMQSMSLNRLRKAPAPNGRILLGGQDHLFYSIADAFTDPTYCYPGPTGGVPPNVSNAGDIVYSESDPTVLFGSTTSHVYRATGSAITNNWTDISYGGGGVWPLLASTTPISVVAVANGATARYGSSSDGGTTWTWTDCLIGGVALHIYSAGSGFGTIKIVDSDGYGNIYIYDYGAGSHTPAFYKSTDGGQNFTLVSNPANIGALGTGGILRCVPGQPGHMFISAGRSGAGYSLPPAYLLRTVDDGVTWDVFSTANGSGSGATYTVWGVAAGKAKPGGNGYPAIFITASLTGTRNDMTTSGVYRCDDMPISGATSALRTTCTWTHLPNSFKCNTDGNASGMDADMDVYGDVYMAMSASGYMFGSMSF